jgi:hypothetical protein
VEREPEFGNGLNEAPRAFEPPEQSPPYKARPVKEPVDYAGLRGKIVTKFSKTLARLAK